jgi:hypothetical protein
MVIGSEEKNPIWFVVSHQPRNGCQITDIDNFVPRRPVCAGSASRNADHRKAAANELIP